MPLLLVNAPTGIQELIEIHVTGKYFDNSRVVWDERRDGTFSAPLNQVGGLIRVGNTLTFNATMKAADDAQKVVLDAPAKLVRDRLQRLRNADLTLFPLAERPILQDLIDHAVGATTPRTNLSKQIQLHEKKILGFWGRFFKWLLGR